METDQKDNKRRQRSLDLLKKAREKKMMQQSKDSELPTINQGTIPKKMVPVISPDVILDKLESEVPIDNKEEAYLIITDEHGNFSRPGFQINVWYKLHFSDCTHTKTYIPKKSYDARNIQTYLLTEIGKTLPVINIDHIKSHCNDCLQNYIKTYEYTLLSVEIIDSTTVNNVQITYNDKHGIITVPSAVTEQHQLNLMDLWYENNLGFIPIVRINETILSVLKMIPSWFIGDLNYILSLPLANCDVLTDVDNEDLDGLVDTLSVSDVSVHQTYLPEVVEDVEQDEISKAYTNTDWTLDIPEAISVKFFKDGGVFLSSLEVMTHKYEEITLLKYLVEAGFKYWKDVMMNAPNEWFQFPSPNNTGLTCETLNLALKDWGIRSDVLFYNLIPILSKQSKFNLVDIGMRLEQDSSIFLCVYSQNGQ